MPQKNRLMAGRLSCAASARIISHCSSSERCEKQLSLRPEGLPKEPAVARLLDEAQHADAHRLVRVPVELEHTGPLASSDGLDAIEGVQPNLGADRAQPGGQVDGLLGSDIEERLDTLQLLDGRHSKATE